MRHSALGLVEVRGYLGAVAAADAALKAASVACIGVEIIKGGLVTVKLSGDVGAVQAAVEAGAEAATQLDVLVTRHVIARLHEETAAMIENPAGTDGSQEQQEDVATGSALDHVDSSITKEVSEPSAVMEASQADKAELASAAATKEVGEIKPSTDQKGTVHAINTAEAAEKPTGAQNNHSNGNNSHVKPAPAPVAKRTKNSKKKASS